MGDLLAAGGELLLVQSDGLDDRQQVLHLVAPLDGASAEAAVLRLLATALRLPKGILKILKDPESIACARKGRLDAVGELAVIQRLFQLLQIQCADLVQILERGDLPHGMH